MQLRGRRSIFFLVMLLLYAAARIDACTVRVLLDRGAIPEKKSWRLHAKRGFVLIDPRYPRKRMVYKKKVLLVQIIQGALYIDHKRYTHHQLYIKPSGCNFITYDHHEYPGAFLIARDQQAIYLINTVGLERYLYGVLKTEGWPGWPLEVDKVFAVACRSYVLEKKEEARRAKRIYHVCNTNAHQTYKGHHTSNHLKQAVQQTRGLFLAYENKPIIAMFDSCCGGIIPARVSGLDFEKAPYLARPYACTHCKACSIYRWQFSITMKELEQKLTNAQRAKLSTIKAVRITKKDSAGLVQELEIQGTKGNIIINGKEFYSWFKEIRSFVYTVQRKGNTMLFSGNGYGHHVGLCQWGAREMVRNGWDYRSILQFYYPGTRFVKLRR